MLFFKFIHNLKQINQAFYFLDLKLLNNILEIFNNFFSSKRADINCTPKGKLATNLEGIDIEQIPANEGALRN